MAPRTTAAGPRMRPDASRTQSAGNGAANRSESRLCDCGCGSSFVPIRHQRFLNDDHRKHAWLEKNSYPSALAAFKKEWAEIKRRLSEIETSLGLNKKGD